MCARKRSLHDHAIADIACTLLIERGPQALTFAEVSKRCGLAPATLIQRFASRTGLLEAAAARLGERVTVTFAGTPSTPNGRYLTQLTDSLERLAPIQGAATLLADAVDLSAFSNEVRKQISYQLAVAVEAGELPRCDIAELARTLQITFAGAVGTARIERSDVATEVNAAIASQLAVYV